MPFVLSSLLRYVIRYGHNTTYRLRVELRQLLQFFVMFCEMDLRAGGFITHDKLKAKKRVGFFASGLSLFGLCCQVNATLFLRYFVQQKRRLSHLTGLAFVIVIPI